MFLVNSLRHGNSRLKYSRWGGRFGFVLSQYIRITYEYEETIVANAIMLVLVLVLVLIKDLLIIKRMLATWHPYTRASFLCQWLQSDTGKRMLSSPPASPLPKYGRNRIRAGQRTKTQPNIVIRANVCLVRHPCHNFAYDTETVNTY